MKQSIDDLMPKRRNSIGNALQLRLFGIKPSLYITSHNTGISLGICPANERHRYNVMTSLIGCTHTQTDPW